MLLLKLAILFIGVPLLELAILVRLGTVIGFWPTMGIVILTGALGALLAKLEGFRVWLQIRRDLAAGRMPVAELVDGLLIFAGGLVLLTPGLLTDLLGFALLIPWTRKAFRYWLGRRLRRMLRTGRVNVTMLLD